MKLICYVTSGTPPKVVPAPLERDWMEASTEGFAYRCLPLNIANGHGWLVLNSTPVVARWDGGAGRDAVLIESEPVEGAVQMAVSHFGHGVLTFHVNGLFRTEPGYDLFVTGPANRLKDGIQPLTGVVETDWAASTFTMNWRFTRKHTPVAFEVDEPICMIFPVQRGLVESVEPEFRSFDADPELKAAYDAWAASRANFIDDLHVEGSEARKKKWQKEYFRGESASGDKPKDHRTKLRVRPFKNPG